MEHPLARVVRVAHDEARRPVLGHVHHVFPAAERLGHAVAIEHLELEAVQVKRVIHPHQVLELPDLRRAQRRRHIHAIVVASTAR